MEAGGGVQRCGAAASCTAPLRTMACPGGQDAARLERLVHPFGSGGYIRLQQREGSGLDTVDRGEGRWLIMDMVGVSTCHGMAMSMHKGRVQWVRGCSIGLWMMLESS